MCLGQNLPNISTYSRFGGADRGTETRGSRSPPARQARLLSLLYSIAPISKQLIFYSQ